MGALPCAVALVSVWLVGVSPLVASIMRFVPIEELAGESSLVVRARITGQSVHWTENHEGIYTQIEAVVLGPLKGQPPRQGTADVRRLTIIQAGGVIDDVSLDWTGRPTFRTGEDLILFLQPYDSTDPADSRLLVVAGKQGRMRVIEDPRGKAPVMVERDLTGVLDAPFIEGDEPTGPAPRRDLIPLEEVARRVREADGGSAR
jgi:hypothetical protein